MLRNTSLRNTFAQEHVANHPTAVVEMQHDARRMSRPSQRQAGSRRAHTNVGLGQSRGAALAMQARAASGTGRCSARRRASTARAHLPGIRCCLSGTVSDRLYRRNQRLDARAALYLGTAAAFEVDQHGVDAVDGFQRMLHRRGAVPTHHSGHAEHNRPRFGWSRGGSAKAGAFDSGYERGCVCGALHRRTGRERHHSILDTWHCLEDVGNSRRAVATSHARHSKRDLVHERRGGRGLARRNLVIRGRNLAEPRRLGEPQRPPALPDDRCGSRSTCPSKLLFSLHSKPQPS